LVEVVYIVYGSQNGTKSDVSYKTKRYIMVANKDNSNDDIYKDGFGGGRIMAAPEIDSADGVKVGGVTFNGGAVSGVTTPLSAAQGGTGVPDDSYDADKVDGCDAGAAEGNVFKVPTVSWYGGIFYIDSVGALTYLTTSAVTSGYQLTTGGQNSTPSWAASSDLIFSDTHCPKCGQEFQDGDDLILHVIGHNEVGDILTIPMHLSCANEPKKTVVLEQKVMEDTYVLDEYTGELKIQRVVKTQDKVVTKHVVKDGYMIDRKSGKAHKVDEEGNVENADMLLLDALETMEETVSKIVYEEAEFEL
jgi:hypothetical protein